MSVTFEKNYDMRILAKGLEDVKLVLDDMITVGKDQIVANTKAGIDCNDKEFAKYAEETKKMKTKYGKSPSLVNLEHGKDSKGKATSGNMMTSIATKITGNLAETYFIDANKGLLAYYHQTGQGDLPIREFVGWTKKADTMINKIYNKFLDKLLRKI